MAPKLVYCTAAESKRKKRSLPVSTRFPPQTEDGWGDAEWDDRTHVSRPKYKMRTERFLREKLISEYGLFSAYETQQGAANGQDSCGVFSGMYWALNGWMLARAPASPAQGLPHHEPRYFICYFFCMVCDLEKLGLIDQS